MGLMPGPNWLTNMLFLRHLTWFVCFGADLRADIVRVQENFHEKALLATSQKSEQRAHSSHLLFKSHLATENSLMSSSRVGVHTVTAADWMYTLCFGVHSGLVVTVLDWRLSGPWLKPCLLHHCEFQGVVDLILYKSKASPSHSLSMWVGK